MQVPHAFLTWFHFLRVSCSLQVSVRSESDVEEAASAIQYTRHASIANQADDSPMVEIGDAKTRVGTICSVSISCDVDPVRV